MTQAPVITQAHFEAAFEQHGYHTDLLTIMNTCNQIALAEQEELENAANESINQLVEQATQDRFISAKEAEALADERGAKYLDLNGMWKNCEGFNCYVYSPIDGRKIVYRAIRKEVPAEPTCQVRNDDTGVTETMTRGAAQKLQAETKDVCDWSWCNSIIGTSYIDGLFDHSGGIYTYRSKAKKPVSWKDVPVGVMTNKGLFVGTYSSLGLTFIDLLQDAQTGNGKDCIAYRTTEGAELAPADQQPWFNWRGGDCPVPEGVVVEVTFRDGEKLIGHAHNIRWRHESHNADIIEYRVIGIADGWELK